MKVAVVTGATGGIGERIAAGLVKKGYVVYSLARSRKNAEGVRYRLVDLSDFEAAGEAVRQIAEEAGRIDLLVNNAGIGIGGAVETHTDEEIARLMTVNFTAAVALTNRVIPYLRQTKGRIVNIGSVAGELPIPFQTMYSASKSAIHAYSAALAGELHPFGIKVSCVIPGDTRTPFTANRQMAKHDDLYADRAERSIRRMERDEQNGTSPDRVAEVVVRCATQKRPPLRVAVGAKYKLFLIIGKLLPFGIVGAILNKLYAE
ncbi:MAG TPA: SDR family NAD(P)-dependent oxidoreductase [Candidatus Stercoripulliclostridium merdipullorum]|uniref:SDR family NAD(P)-dependent oxidoreductase n=1 Tax=Candidatus Stercoripulliclostridium merdipullorum TaxID=2840952 RepID=A0A9D1ND96_9FIRM|nr:SDR family NAD(P)-dependent oxidoreductase [Candidatus Stercoripulliclostridium merdipullorum]